MSLPAVTGVAPRWESALAELIGSSGTAQLVRRCADVPELLGVSAAGLARVAVVSSDFRALDRAAVEALLASGVAVVGVHPPGQTDGGRTLRRWGIQVVHPANLDAGTLEEAIASALDGTGPGQPVEGGGGSHEGGHGSRDRAEGKDLADRHPAAVPEPLENIALAEPLQPRPETSDSVDEELRRLVEEAGAGPPTPGLPAGASTADEEPRSEPGQVIVVWGPGSPGRTTVALNLATELAGPLSRVVLIDADTSGAALAQCLAVLDEAPGLAAAARAADQGTLDARALDRLAPEVRPGLQLLSGLPRADRWPEIRDSALADIIEVARRCAAFVVIDVAPDVEQDEELSFDTAAPRRNGATITALESADRVVVVGAGDPVGLQRLVRGIDALPTLTGAPREVVVTRVRPGPVGPEPERRIQEALERFAGTRVVHLVPEDRESLDAALLHGRALAEVRPASPARVSIRRLADQIADRELATRRPAVRWWARRPRT